jgi:hypothetical protein
MKKWVITVVAALVLATAALTAHQWVPPVVKFVGEKLLNDEKVSRLNDLVELISKIVAWSLAAIWFFVRLWRGTESDGHGTSADAINETEVTVKDNAKVDGDVVGGNKQVAEGDIVEGEKDVAHGGDVVHGDKIVYQSMAAPTTAPLTTLFQLPPPPGDFTGREAELRELLQAIEHGGVHISGLAGQGGVGKTALALKLADELKLRFSDAQIFLDLKGAPKGAGQDPAGAGDKRLPLLRRWRLWCAASIRRPSYPKKKRT